jgi:hypothetical protein
VLCATWLTCSVYHVPVAAAYWALGSTWLVIVCKGSRLQWQRMVTGAPSRSTWQTSAGRQSQWVARKARRMCLSRGGAPDNLFCDAFGTQVAVVAAVLHHLSSGCCWCCAAAFQGCGRIPVLRRSCICHRVELQPMLTPDCEFQVARSEAGNGSHGWNLEFRSVSSVAANQQPFYMQTVDPSWFCRSFQKL